MIATSSGGKVFLGPVTVSENGYKVLSIRDLFPALCSHATQDWGGVAENVRRRNEAALLSGGIVTSEFYSLNGVKFFIETDIGERFTQVHLAEEVETSM